MQPNQPIPPSFPAGENPYDFILQGPPKQKKTLMPAGGSQKQRILLVVSGLVIFILLAIVVIGIISSAGSEDTQAFLGISQTQTELVRVSTAGSTNARDLTTQGFAQSIKMVLTTNQQQTSSYLKAHNIKQNPKTLALGRSAKTDAALKTADQAGRYDDELVTVLEASLGSYKTQLNTAYGKSTSLSQKKLLLNLYNQANLLTKNQPTKS